MNTAKKLKLAARRKQRVRYKLKQAKKLRLSVYISNRHISAQIIDDKLGHTLAAISSLSKEFKERVQKSSDANLCNVENARQLGKMLAEKALAAGIQEDLVYDRGSKHYHGRVKALAEAAREAGLRF